MYVPCLVWHDTHWWWITTTITMRVHTVYYPMNSNQFDVDDDDAVCASVHHVVVVVAVVHHNHQHCHNPLPCLHHLKEL